MLISYCDLCGTPLKDGNFYMLYISESKNTNYTEPESYYDYTKRIQKGVKEICPSCKYVFDKIFELRLQRLSELALEINSMYNLNSKKNPKERNNDKEK